MTWNSPNFKSRNPKALGIQWKIFEVWNFKPWCFKATLEIHSTKFCVEQKITNSSKKRLSRSERRENLVEIWFEKQKKYKKKQISAKYDQKYD